MKRSAIIQMPEYFDRYINLVEDISLIDALEKYGVSYLRAEQKKFEKLGDEVYAPGKWTIKDIIQHYIDTERVFTYRALRFARTDTTVLPGYDENLFAENTNTSNQSLEELLNEFDLVRKSTIAMYKGFTNEMLNRKGICFNKEISVLAIGFTMPGHVIHHMNVIKERYFPLLEKAGV
jgi:hypothetical protein